MKIIKPSFEILTPISEGGVYELTFIENAGKTCYKSSTNCEDFSRTKKFVQNLINNGHHSVLEHSILTVKFIVDRAIANELVRHRIASYSQESTRYCNYSNDRFNGELTFIEPCYWDPESLGYDYWRNAVEKAEEAYLDLLKNGETPEKARAVLPLSLKTEIVMTANYREWRNFFKLRTADDCHPQMLEVTRPLLEELKSLIPVIFDDIMYKKEKEDNE